jgi:S-adenosylmethionine-diacylglycerol 3-amino-3-carboxypropyl transferase
MKKKRLVVILRFGFASAKLLPKVEKTMQATTEKLLKKAVHYHPAVSRRGLSERAFTAWFSGFVYNQIWEDPAVDVEALRLDASSRILTISSGGCNVLNYLLRSPAKIVAIDLNTCHMSLTRLKLAAVARLEHHRDFYDFFGFGDRGHNLANYHNRIKPFLDETTRGFWESTGWPGRKLGRRRIDYFARGFYDTAKLGGFLRFVHLLCKVTDRDPSRLFEAKTVAEQEAIFTDLYDPFFDSRFVKFLGRMPATVFSLGIPPSQHKIMDEESGGNIVETFRQRVRKLACATPLERNYFAWQAFGRRYDHEHRRAVPDYLREENFPTLRANVSRVETHITSVSDYLKTQPAGALNRFVLLDSQDWMPAAVIEQLWSQIARVGERGSRIIFRTAGGKSPVEQSLPAELMRRFTCEKELAMKLHEQDRSAIYGMFHVYCLNG